jgi:hypothetical protein
MAESRTRSHLGNLARQFVAGEFRVLSAWASSGSCPEDAGCDLPARERG